MPLDARVTVTGFVAADAPPDETETVRVTAPENPLMLVNVIVLVPDWPALIPRLDLEDEIVKSPTVTVNWIL